MENGHHRLLLINPNPCVDVTICPTNVPILFQDPAQDPTWHVAGMTLWSPLLWTCSPIFTVFNDPDIFEELFCISVLIKRTF
jgi:hypothetical protein